jgi:hypothetical protein
MRCLIRHLCLGALLGVAGAAARGEAPLRMTAEPAFAGMSGSGTTPVVVTIQNTGPSTDGILTVDPSTFSIGSAHHYTYPLSLPTGSVKKVTVYPWVGDYSEPLTVKFSGSGGRAEVSQDVAMISNQATQIGLIGDQAGGLGGLRVLPPPAGAPRPTGPPGQETPTFQDSYAAPEDAPDRAVGYSKFSALVLANGAERMNPAQWTAIRRWVLAGGSLVLTGGAGAVYLQTPGAAALSPVPHTAGATVPALSLAGASLPPGPYALTTGEPLKDAAVLARQDGRVVLAARTLGAGTVLFTAFSPFEKPLRGWKGGGALWKTLLSDAAPGIAWPRLRGVSSLLQSVADNGMRGRGAAAENVNPFHVTLPPVSTVAVIFAIYFLLAVPVTYFVLKKARRLEWAWITNPVMACSFAFVFYLFAARLYQAGMSRRTTGVVIAQAGSDDALFLGATQMFFPRGGRFPLSIPNAETLEATSPDNRYGLPGRKMETLTTSDNGVVSAPDYTVTNLAFRNIAYVQPVTATGSVTAALRRDAAGKLTGTVRNGTGEEIRNAAVILPASGMFTPLGTLKAGATARLGAMQRGWTPTRAPEVRPRRWGSGLPPMPAPGRTLKRDLEGIGGASEMLARTAIGGAAPNRADYGALLVGTTAGDPYGPRMGRSVPGGGVGLVVGLPVEGGA